jgi:beta-galactosidase
LWSIKSPNLYSAVTTVEQSGRVVDRYETVFGIRTIRFDAGGGFLLNGERVSLNGVCNHHDLGALGSAINTRALERQIELLKEMGANAIRTSHNPPAPELLELCDRMGMVLMVEAFDCWRAGKTRNDYHLVFDDWHEKDLRAMVRRDRNHPSVVLWSIGNEIREQQGADGIKLASELAAIVREEDSTRPVTAGCNNVGAGYNGFQKTVDVFGYNYKPAEYRKFREQNPGIPIAGSETSSCVSTRGEYFFPVSNDKNEGKADFQVSSYDLYAPPWAWPPDTEWKGLDENPFVAGEFVWTGFDYLGEPTPYNRDVTNLLNFTDEAEKQRMEKALKELGKILVPSRRSYFGIIDLAGFKKDRFYIYQSRWRPDLPMAHILPHWNWPERVGQVTPVHVYSSGDEVELFLNGQSLGRKREEPLQYRFRWDDVKYAAGELRAVAYRGGSKWAENSVKTTGPAAKLLLQPDRGTLRADGSDLAFVTVTVADKAGLAVPRTRNLVRFEIGGPGDIVAVDNGDPTSHDSFQAHERKALNGLCLVIVRSRKGESGAIALTARSEGLEGGMLTVRASK